MMSRHEGLRARASLGDRVPSLELHLSRRAFARGRQLSGVVLLRLSRSVDIKSLMVSVEGGEFTSSSKLRGKLRQAGPFFKRDVLLSGRDRPRFVSERLSQYWNAFLKREHYRTLSSGEYTYPFTLPLPGSLPPSCEARAGKIVYRVTARLKFPLGRVLQVSTEVPVAFAHKDSPQESFTLSHSSVYGGKHATGADLTIELPGRSFTRGTPIEGKLVLSNSRRLPMGPISITLERFEGLRTDRRGGPDQAGVGSVSFTPQDPCASEITTDFQLDIPPDAPPSVEGTSLLVAWSLNVRVEACPPVELRVPVIVRVPVA